MGRPTKLTPEVGDIIIHHIAQCATYEAAVNAAGIAYSTFRNWIKRGEQDLAWCDAHPNGLVLPEELLYLQFLEAVTRARAEALTNASQSIHQGITGAVAHEYTRETVTEPVRDKAGNILLGKDKEPKMYTRTLERETVRQKEPDWRAAITFLERRDPEMWSNKLVIEATLKHVPPDALQLLPELAGAAEEAGLDLHQVFNEMLIQLGKVRVG